MLDVTTVILATIKHQLPESESRPACLLLFLDLDLEVLSVRQLFIACKASNTLHPVLQTLHPVLQRPIQEYVAYASQIRAEYAHVPTDGYRTGRTAVLRHLSEGDIYFTDHAKISMRNAARANMQDEIKRLADPHELL